MTDAKIVITGTGRAGTTLLLQVLTDLGLDTGVTDDSPFDAVSHAGLERHILDPTAPRIIKDPFLSTELRALLEQQLVAVEHVIVPMRRLDIAAASRIRASDYGARPENWGGLVGTRDAEAQQASLAEMLSSLTETIAEFDIPFTLLWFPRFTTDWRYTHAQLGWLTPHLDAEAWRVALERRVRPEWIHETPLSETEQASIVESVSESPQRFPEGHRAVAEGAPTLEYFRALRELVDETGEVYEFVRSYRRAAPPEPDPAFVDTPRPFLTVITRTRGDRIALLRDTLVCLAAQTDDDFEVQLVVHSSDRTALTRVTELVESFHGSFAQRVNVIAAVDGGRARPLNVGLDRARGRYIAFLDDDDVVTGDWVAAFRLGESTGMVVRSRCYVRAVEPAAHPDIPYSIRERPRPWYAPAYDAIEHLYANQTPICSFAIPRNLVDNLELRFDESLPVLEDWEFLVRCATRAGVVDTAEITSIYNFWHRSAGSRALHDEAMWSGTQAAILERWDARPLLLFEDSATQLHEMQRRLAELEANYAISESERQKASAHIESIEHELGVYRRVGLEKAMRIPRGAFRRLKASRTSDSDQD